MQSVNYMCVRFKARELHRARAQELQSASYRVCGCVRVGVIIRVGYFGLVAPMAVASLPEYDGLPRLGHVHAQLY